MPDNEWVSEESEPLIHDVHFVNSLWCAFDRGTY